MSKFLSGLVLSVAVLAPTFAVAQDVKIGFVNTQRILRDSKFATDSQAKLEQSFAGRQKELTDLAAKVRSEAVKLDKDAITLSDSEKVTRQRQLAEMDRDFQRKRREFDEDLAQKKNQLVGELVERANKVIRQIAEKENYDLIFQDAVYANPRIDITDKVLRNLDAVK
ncbi:MAG: OmpH family outer membrane protein [Limnobacter sp.]|nr:OmpH family outer membrane protein [Limnobacter sp.]